MSVTLEQYLALQQQVIDAGYEQDITWAETVQPVSDPIEFWSNYAWVVLNSGMKNQVAQGIWDRVRPRVLDGGSASDVFGHVGKAAGIDKVYAERVELLLAYRESPDKVQFLRGLPWIGPITCWHLAKNYGLDCAKPDRHLVRIAGEEGVDELCRRLAQGAGQRVGTTDYVLWRSANLGLI